MAATGTPTPNLGLRIPVGTDPASVDDINYNSNLLDTKIGAVGNTPVQDQIDELSGQIAITNVTDWHNLKPDGSPGRKYGYSNSASVSNQPMTGNNTYFGYAEGWNTYYVVHLIVHYANSSAEIGAEYNAYYSNGTWTPWIKVSGNNRRNVSITANSTYRFKFDSAYGAARVYIWGYDSQSIGMFMIHNNNGSLTYKAIETPTAFSISMASNGTVTITSTYQYTVVCEIEAVIGTLTFT